jgi:hypothetical protein
MIYNSADLISAIKRNASIPSSQVKFSNTDFLKFLNEELQLTMVNKLLSLRQDYFVTTLTTILSPSTSAYDIPTSAIGWKLEAVGYLDNNGNYTQLPLIARDQRDAFYSLDTSTIPKGFYIMGNTLHLVPSVGSTVTGSLEYDYVRIQNELVLPTACGLISTVVDTGTAYQMTVDTVPIATGETCDVVSGTNPFNIIARGVVGTVAGAVISATYGTSFSRAPVAGDYVCEAGKTPIPNIPEDFHPVLAQMAVIRCLASNNDVNGIQAQGLVLSNMLDVVSKRSSKRISDTPRKIKGNDYILNLMRRGY